MRSRASSCRPEPTSSARRPSSASRAAGTRGSARTSRTTARSTTGCRRAEPTFRWPARGRSTRFSEHLGALPLFDEEPGQHAFLDYRRWAFESAALDLALRQAGLSLGGAVGREPRPVSFVVSMGLGSPPSTERVHAWLGLYPGLRFKLDATTEWTDELVAELAATNAVDSIDLKGHYRGTVVDAPPDAATVPPRRRGAADRVDRGPGAH